MDNGIGETIIIRQTIINVNQYRPPSSIDTRQMEKEIRKRVLHASRLQ